MNSLPEMSRPAFTQSTAKTSLLRKLSLIRREVKGSGVPLAFVALGTLAKRIQWLAPFARYPARRVVTLRTRTGRLEINVPITDAWPVFEVFAFREYDFAIARNPHWVIDCGAHVGSFSIWLASQLPCHILAVEPNPSIHELLDHNVQPFGSRIRILKAALANDARPRHLYQSGFPGGASLIKSASHSTQTIVEAVTLRHLIKVSGFPHVDLLKLDIEGSEQEVFECVSPETLGQVRAVIIECHAWLAVNIESISRRLKESGMRVDCHDHRILTAWRD